MTDEQQPELRWAPTDPAPSNRWRIWLIVGLIVAGLVVVAVLVFLLLPRGESPAPGASPSASPTASSSPTASASPEPEPSMTPVTTPPPPVDPTVEAFRGQVQANLDNALTGLDIVAESDGDTALAVLETLEDDAQRLSETPAPSSIADAWGDALGTYTQSLANLRDAVDAGGDRSGALEDARAAVEALREIVGL